MTLTRRSSKTANKDKGHAQHQRESIDDDTITKSIPQTGKETSNGPKGRNNTITKRKIINVQSIEVILILITPILLTIGTLHNGFGSLFGFLIQLSRFISQSSFKKLIDTRYIRLQQGNVTIDGSKKLDHSISINTDLFSHSKKRFKSSIDILDIAINLCYMGKDIRDSIIDSSYTSISPRQNITDNTTNIFIRTCYILRTPICKIHTKAGNSVTIIIAILRRIVKVKTITIPCSIVRINLISCTLKIQIQASRPCRCSNKDNVSIIRSVKFITNKPISISGSSAKTDTTSTNTNAEFDNAMKVMTNLRVTKLRSKNNIGIPIIKICVRHTDIRTNLIILNFSTATKIFATKRHRINTSRFFCRRKLPSLPSNIKILTRRMKNPIPKKVIRSIIRRDGYRPNRDKKQGTAESDQRSAGP